MFCNTRDGMLRHPWGSNKLYRSYFQDYEMFQDRPAIVAKSILGQSERLFIVSSDLTQFYDLVNPHNLTDALKEFETSSDESEFFEFAKRVLSWVWDERDFQSVTNYVDSSNDICRETFCSVALPQGLAAAGFFANVVLIGFDRKIKIGIGREIAQGIYLKDACRYVDDMRFVIAADQSQDKNDVKEAVYAWVKKNLKEVAPFLKVSCEKTIAAEFPGSEPAVGLRSAGRKRIQAAISGGFDAADGIEIIERLQGLKGLRQDSGESSQLFAPNPDVRDETVQRFKAGRFRKVYRSIRPLLQEEEISATKSKNKEFIGTDRSQEELDEVARSNVHEFIGYWVDNPANVRMLRIGLDICPDPQILKRVLTLLRPFTISSEHCMAQRRIAWYCLAELLRAGATETGIVEDYRCLPASADPEQFQNVLREEATRVAHLPQKAIPWYLRQQALLYLAVIAPSSINVAEIGIDDEFKHYRRAILFRQGKFAELDNSEFATFAILARRAFPKGKELADLIRPVLTSPRKAEIAKRDPDFVLELSVGDEGFFEGLPDPIRESLCRGSDQTTGERISLAKAVLDSESQSRYWLRNELTILEFSLALLKKLQEGQDCESPMTIVPGKVLIRQKTNGEFADIDCVEASTPQTDGLGTLYQPPYWCHSNEHWRFQLGFLLRFILTGREDFTSAIYRKYSDEPPVQYRSVQSFWYERIYGLLNIQESFGDDLLPISDWIENFLLALLHWPGVQPPSGFGWVKAGIEKTSEEIQERISELKERLGSSTSTLILPMVLKRPTQESLLRSLRGCVVQTVVPSEKDFEKDPTVSGQDIRRKHRRHISAALAAVERMLILRKTHDKGNGQLDWLILPELSVHPLDVKPHLFTFAKKHKTLILAGLTYQDLFEGQKLINSALWIIPEMTDRNTIQIKTRRQGKLYIDPDKRNLKNLASKLEGIRPCQWLVGFPWSNDAEQDPLWLTGSICFDATDLGLTADLRFQSDVLAVPAFNKDVRTFDQMALALHYHMFQLVIIVNNGKYGGSNAYWPVHGDHGKQMFHLHGQPQAAIAFFEIEDISSLKERRNPTPPKKEATVIEWKHPPAGSCSQ